MNWRLQPGRATCTCLAPALHLRLHLQGPSAEQVDVRPGMTHSLSPRSCLDNQSLPISQSPRTEERGLFLFLALYLYLYLVSSLGTGVERCITCIKSFKSCTLLS